MFRAKFFLFSNQSLRNCTVLTVSWVFGGSKIEVKWKLILTVFSELIVSHLAVMQSTELVSTCAFAGMTRSWVTDQSL